MALVSISAEDKKTIIWSFMEELIENSQNAIENNLPTNFNYLDFFNFGVLSNSFSEEDKKSVIKQYAKETGYIRFRGDTVALTKKGIREAGKPKHSWDK